jgi:ribosome maturation factor RimP
MTELRQNIADLVTMPLKGSAYFLVDVVISGIKAVPKITVWVDGDAGIPIDKCAEISRRLSKQIEDRELITSAYTLEVSSPGIDQPLKLYRQYKQHIGRKVQVHLLDGTSKTGRLEAVHENSIIVAEEKKKTKKEEADISAEIAVADIDKTFVLVSFN